MMPLTPEEIAFLGPTLAEYSDIQFGPAWQCLRDRGIGSDDLVWLMEAYKFVDPPGIETVVDPNGVTSDVFRLGHHQEPLSPCPWAVAEAARKRNREIEAEVRKQCESQSP
jgi:hypothetical protein